MFKGFQLTNLPPRTTVNKHLSLRCNTSEGNLQVCLRGGWSEYKPEQVKEIMKGMQSWLDSLIPWTCEFCGYYENFTLREHSGSAGFGYDWVRCRDCKNKTKRIDLGLTN